jgi:bifunctional ADP-heptose synthase (sugar kinase/adenylyltransferase)
MKHRCIWNPVENKYDVQSERLSDEERTRLIEESRQKMKWDMQGRIKSAQKMVAIDYAKGLLANNYDIKYIAEITGLEHDEIKKLHSKGNNDER